MLYMIDYTFIVLERRTKLYKVFLLLLCSVICCAGAQSAPDGDGLNTEQMTPKCPAPIWVQFNNSCYAFLTISQKDSLNMELAEELCKDFGAHVISIQSQEENTFLLKMLQTKWKGPKEVLLGMFYDSDDDTMKWFDKSPVTFFNWRPEIIHEDLNTCVTMSAATGAWDFTECDGFAESSTLCKTRLSPREREQVGQQVLIIGLITAFALTIPSVLLVLYILQKKNKFVSGFSSTRLPGAANVLPYSDDDVLVDNMEGEDCA